MLLLLFNFDGVAVAAWFFEGKQEMHVTMLLVGFFKLNISVCNLIPNELHNRIFLVYVPHVLHPCYNLHLVCL